MKTSKVEKKKKRIKENLMLHRDRAVFVFRATGEFGLVLLATARTAAVSRSGSPLANLDVMREKSRDEPAEIHTRLARNIPAV